MYNTTMHWLWEKKDECFSLFMANWPYILSTAIFLFSVTRSRRFWMNICHLATLVESIYAVSCPRSYLSLSVVGEVDEGHIRVVRSCAILMFLWVLRYWLLTRSTDSTIVTSQLWAMTVLSGCLLMASGYSLTHIQKKAAVKISAEGMPLFFYFALLFTVGTSYHAIKSTDWGGYNELNVRSSIHLRLDFVALMIAGVCMYALPSWFLKLRAVTGKVDSVHTCFTRAVASLMIAMAIVSGRSANFLRSGDKECVMVVHLMYYIVGLFMVSADLLPIWSNITWIQVVMPLSWYILLISNAYGALNSDISVFKRIVWPAVAQIPQDIRSMLKLKQY